MSIGVCQLTTSTLSKKGTGRWCFGRTTCTEEKASTYLYTFCACRSWHYERKERMSPARAAKRWCAGAKWRVKRLRSVDRGRFSEANYDDFHRSCRSLKPWNYLRFCHGAFVSFARTIKPLSMSAPAAQKAATKIVVCGGNGFLGSSFNPHQQAAHLRFD